jgi:hypothetical protein
VGTLRMGAPAASTEYACAALHCTGALAAIHHLQAAQRRDWQTSDLGRGMLFVLRRDTWDVLRLGWDCRCYLSMLPVTAGLDRLQHIWFAAGSCVGAATRARTQRRTCPSRRLYWLKKFHLLRCASTPRCPLSARPYCLTPVGSA